MDISYKWNMQYVAYWTSFFHLNFFKARTHCIMYQCFMSVRAHVCRSAFIYVHVEARGQSWLSFIRCHPSCLKTGSLSGLGLAH